MCDSCRTEGAAGLPSEALVTVGPGSPSPPTWASIISRTVRVGSVAARDSLQEHGFNYSSSGLWSTASPSACQRRPGDGEGAGRLGEGPGFPDGLAKTPAGAKPRAAAAKAGLGRGLLLGSVQATRGRRAGSGLPPSSPAGHPPACLRHKMAEGCGGHFVEPQEDKGSRPQPGAGTGPRRRGGATSTPGVRPAVLCGGPGGPGQEERGQAVPSLEPSSSPSQASATLGSPLRGAPGSLGACSCPGQWHGCPPTLRRRQPSSRWGGGRADRLTASFCTKTLLCPRPSKGGLHSPHWGGGMASDQMAGGAGPHSRDTPVHPTLWSRPVTSSCSLPADSGTACRTGHARAVPGRGGRDTGGPRKTSLREAFLGPSRPPTAPRHDLVGSGCPPRAHIFLTPRCPQSLRLYHILLRTPNVRQRQAGLHSGGHGSTCAEWKPGAEANPT